MSLDAETIIKLKRDGLPVDVIAFRAGVPADRVHAITRNARKTGLLPKARGQNAARNRRIVDMACEGMRPIEIADELGLTQNLVSCVLRDARQAGEAIPYARRAGGRPKGKGRAMTLPPRMVQALTPHAEARGVCPRALALRLLDIIVEDGMVDAILDDGGDDD